MVEQPVAEPPPDALIESRCSSCGYGISVRIAPDRSPIRGKHAWVPVGRRVQIPGLRRVGR